MINDFSQNVVSPMSVSKISRAIRKAKAIRKDFVQRKRDFDNERICLLHLGVRTNSLVRVGDLDVAGIDLQTAIYLTKMYLSHRFDLLGTGWIMMSYNSEAPGLEGNKYYMNVDIDCFDKEGRWLEKILLSPHIESSQRIWPYTSPNYLPIDWQKDYKSGFRWDERKWYKEQTQNVLPGVDMKIPWELARMQHLPQMAVFAMILHDFKYRLIKEFRNQVLDFIATNPPRMGINWVSTMDVSIRAANMLIAYDMLTQLDEFDILDPEFKQIFANSIYEHGIHIVNNLEYSSRHTTNHYLSNIAGLLYVSVYLERNTEVDTWLAFSVQELISEVKKQFYSDGGNFESSTSYHRLSGEFVVYTTALIIGLNEDKKSALTNYGHRKWQFFPKLKALKEQEYTLEGHEFFPEWYVERVFNASLFTAHLTKPTGEVPQIGDNDSGRFFRLSPNGKFITNKQAEKRYLNLTGYNALLDKCSFAVDDNKYWDENTLNHSTFLSSMSGLFDCKEFKFHAEKFPLEQSLIKSLAAKKKLELGDQNQATIQIKNQETDYSELPYQYEQIVQPKEKIEKSLRQNLQYRLYFDSSVYIFSSDRIHMTVCATPVGQNGNGGHTHNDKLSFELNIDEEDYFLDPGSYLYYPLVEKRNLFRSAAAHNLLTPQEMEPNNFRRDKDGLFSMDSDAEVKLLQLGENSITIKMTYQDVTQIRKIEISDECVKILDFSNCELQQEKFGFYSSGYGKLMRRQAWGK